MSNIKNKIKNRYQIDIEKYNLLNLYQIKDAAISDEEIERIFKEKRKKWMQSVSNGVSEKVVERDKERLELAEKFEEILRDSSLRKELFDFYSEISVNDLKETREFIHEFFGTINLSANVQKKNVDFFFDYFTEERKNREYILQILKTELKIFTLGKGKNEENEEIVIPEVNASSFPLPGRFQKKTILQLKKCENIFLKVKMNPSICSHFPNIDNISNLAVFLELNKYKDVESFEQYIRVKNQECFKIRQEFGQEFADLQDLYNIVQEIIKNKDVRDNFEPFKLIICYSKLTPYMFSFTEMKKQVLDKIFIIAKREYGFQSIDEFLNAYFCQVYSNFGIYIDPISSIIKSAQKNAKKAAKINEAFFEKKSEEVGVKLPFGVKLIHIATYWPIFILCLFFEVIKAIVTELRTVTKVLGVCIFVLFSWIGPELFGIKNLSVLRHLFNPKEWYPFVESITGTNIDGNLEFIVTSLYVIVFLLLLYVVLPYAITSFLWEVSTLLNTEIDWAGIERTFQNINKQFWKKTELEYTEQKKKYHKKKVLSILINLIFVIAVIFAIRYAHGYCEGYFANEEPNVYETEYNADEVKRQSAEKSTKMYIKYKISAERANIRKGAGVDHEVLDTVESGKVFKGTGNKKTLSSGTVWYELYLDDKLERTGWASETVLERCSE